MDYKNKHYLINAISLAIAIIVVLGFIYLFPILYQRNEPPHERVIEPDSTVVVIKTASNHEYVFDNNTSQFTIKETVKEEPLVDIYSGFLVALVAVLATFVVVANFANAREVHDAADKAAEADKLIEDSKQILDELKKYREFYEKNRGKIDKIEEMSGKIEDMQKKVDGIKERDEILDELQKSIDDNNQSAIDKEINTAIYFYRQGDYQYPLMVFKKYASTNPVAAYALGLYYQFGYYNVGKDMKEAVKWYKKAAKQGHAMAQCNLGNCFYDGEGVEQDKNEAVKWYKESAKKDFAQAQCNLGVCYERGTGVEQDNEEAVKWYTKAAKQGHAKAQYNLGVSYENGEGVKQDKEEAVEWIKKAAEQGFQDAIDALERLGVKWPEE